MGRLLVQFHVVILSILLYSGATAETYKECLQRLVVDASPSATVADLQSECGEMTRNNRDEVDTAIEERLASEDAVAKNEFSLLQHETNYLLPVAYNFKSDRLEPDVLSEDARELDPTEFKFQISFKTLMWDRPFGTRAGLYAAYTNTSWWQAYNRGESSPFRETNHRPELFVDVPTDMKFLGWELANIRTGVSHESNGRSGQFSRTWNRLYAELAFSNDTSEIIIRPWDSVSDIEDNPDIEDFRGRFEVAGRHLLGRHTLGWRARHTLDSNNRGSVELDWSFPIGRRDDLQFFMQYFDGYGESLIDYNVKSQRFGLGFKLGK